MTGRIRTGLRIAVGVVAGAAAGVGYWTFFGCSGTCPITSDPFLTAGAGALLGLSFAWPSAPAPIPPRTPS